MPGVDFETVRREITMEQVLNLLGFEPSRRSGVQWYGRCPLHEWPSVFHGPVAVAPLKLGWRRRTAPPRVESPTAPSPWPH